MKPKTSPDEDAIRGVLRDWAAATRENRRKAVLRGHDRGALIFDVLAPLQYKGIAAYKKSWADWQPPFEVPSLFDLKQLRVTVGGKVAFCHGLIKCGGKLPSGEVVEDLVRATFCFIKKGKGWKIAHQHLSMPVSP